MTVQGKGEPDIELAPTATATAVAAVPVDVAPTPVLPTPMVSVVAPTTLGEGYMFGASVDGKEFQVTVPPGGVTEGQVFQVPYPVNDTVTKIPGTPVGGDPLLGAPRGRWRDGLFDCCSLCCNPLFWQACCCQPFLMGQLAQRLGLDFCGQPSREYKTTCSTVSIVFAAYYASYLIGLGAFLLPIAFIAILILTMNIRYHYRQKYQIRPSCCDGCDGMCDDCCCAYWCGCCISIQMARHTHEMRQYPYQCCTETGLSAGAPSIV